MFRRVVYLAYKRSSKTRLLDPIRQFIFTILPGFLHSNQLLDPHPCVEENSNVQGRNARAARGGVQESRLVWCAIVLRC
jgi:hypothetical protein